MMCTYAGTVSPRSFPGVGRPWEGSRASFGGAEGAPVPGRDGRKPALPAARPRTGPGSGSSSCALTVRVLKKKASFPAETFRRIFVWSGCRLSTVNGRRRLTFVPDLDGERRCLPGRQSSDPEGHAFRTAIHSHSESPSHWGWRPPVHCRLSLASPAGIQDLRWPASTDPRGHCRHCSHGVSRGGSVLFASLIPDLVPVSMSVGALQAPVRWESLPLHHGM
jgi:hypothetical protein